MEHDSPPNFSSLDEEEAALKARLEKIAQFRALARELGMPLGSFPSAAAPVSPSSTTSPSPPSLTAVSSPPIPETQSFDGTIAGLIQTYRTDERSPYHTLKRSVRNSYDGNFNKITVDFGSHVIADLTADRIMGFYNQWSEGGKIAMGHALAAKLRLLSGFGATVLDDAACIRFAHLMRTLRFPASLPRAVPMTVEYATAVRSKAHEMRWPSIALAQAIQFELKLRQVDVIGEWVPVSDLTPSTVIWGEEKWVRGLRWSDVDDKMILRFSVVDKVKRKIQREVDLTKLPMVLEEIDKFDSMPTSGPMIVCEPTGRPYSPNEFRRKWRLVANKAGLPDNIRNADNIRAESSLPKPESKPAQQDWATTFHKKTAG
ncbi:hypothetical protein [Bradyrhizobium sp. RD5-C2]|uniref:hypothetical protein n=1 Tax=Bradyrhizobium sp. RD5-C2 TaxID=244562 RepID=UPI001CC37998|nr:hypothetical protein [Bradyrhizobium sp. RD5-C2]GIQ73220.1 hypothetical protein BraRD5C2_16580 [Bradyrhizobium sp. RD5-C2]